MRRGDIYWVDLALGADSDDRKIRPAVIVSNDAINIHMNRVHVVPLTSNVSKLYPSEVYVRVMGKKSKAMADQLSVISKLRFRKKVGHLSPAEMAGLEHVIRIQLDLD
jgi:mRNA interferase MazF